MTAPGKGDRQMDKLDDMLRAAKDAPVPDGLMARVLDDALAAQPVPAAASPSLWRRAQDALGGWQGIGGLAMATCAGLWIGLSPPDYLPAEALDLLGATAAMTEGTSGFGWAAFTVDEGTL